MFTSTTRKTLSNLTSTTRHTLTDCKTQCELNSPHTTRESAAEKVSRALTHSLTRKCAASLANQSLPKRRLPQQHSSTITNRSECTLSLSHSREARAQPLVVHLLISSTLLSLCGWKRTPDERTLTSPPPSSPQRPIVRPPSFRPSHMWVLRISHPRPFFFFFL
jgi:hypothetical protein